MADEYFKYKGIDFFAEIYSEENMSFVENHFQVLDDDIFIVTYPKSGTVWMMEIISLIRKNGDPSWCKTVPVWDRAPWLYSTAGLKLLQTYKPPRLLTSHVTVDIFPKSAFNSKAKIIYVYRNPKDVLVSLYCYARIVSFFKTPESFDQFLNLFLNGNVPFGSWFDHVKGWMGIKDKSNILFITYEELLKDLRGSVQKISTFVGKELDEKAIDAIVENASFKSMKENKMANFTLVPADLIDQKDGSFIRKGISGDWRNHFTDQQKEHFDKVYKEKMKDLSVKLIWD
ncbi:sulfotransferase 2B1-like [Pleurodeles waltl]|uniref:sulfotransferase 2B1-like n=1 Tax=Pleurodeles waltl TaxID=8319 RepID=UPI0037095F80